MQKLYDVVFGQNEFEKTKIDVRFEIIKALLPTLSITSLEDFEYLESCLYKIKDQLRVKSSNLNKVIRDTQKSLSKKSVLIVVEYLLNLRNTFLNDAFSALVKEDPSKFEEKSLLNSSLLQPNFDSIIEEKDEQKFNNSKFEEKNIEEKDMESDLMKINPILFENSLYSIVFITTSAPYLKINFKKEVIFPILRDISSILFDSYGAQGSTIIIENQTALIIPRMVGDTTIMPLPQNNDVDIDKNQKILLSLLEDKLKGIQDGEYVEINGSNKINIQTKQEKEDSLDSLLSSIEEKNQSPIPKPNPKEDTSKISIEKSDPIKIEKAPPKFMDNEIEIIKENSLKETEKTTSKKSNLSLDTKKSNVLPNNLVYEDNDLLVYLNSNSKAFGEILIKHKSEKMYGDLSEKELSYISIFTKIFSSILFETLQSQGTNIFWSTNENILHIVPRMQNDTLNFQWKPKEHSEDFLEQIKGKLFQIMSKIMQNSGGQENQNEQMKKTVVNSDVSKNNNDTELKKKAQSVLNALKKIP